MKVVVAGATGFLGRPLVHTLLAEGHDVVVLSRKQRSGNPPVRTVEWTPDGTPGPWATEIDGADAVVNLAGEPIAAQRWTTLQKRRIRDSRVLATRSIVEAFGQAARRPPVLVSGSAVGYYGPLDNEIVTEEQPAGTDFLAEVADLWETEAARAAGERTRVVCVRTGIVLERDGGALPKMLPPFWFGAGGPLGAGKQYWPWIHRKDWIGLVRFALTTDSVRGPLNATAPNPVTNAEFARTLGKVIRRPALLPTPAFALKLILGEMADALLLSGQRAVPLKACQLGFRFSFETLDDALRAIFH
jgi:uncharacterized protein (TIGR01777 family)